MTTEKTPKMRLKKDKLDEANGMRTVFHVPCLFSVRSDFTSIPF